MKELNLPTFNVGKVCILSTERCEIPKLHLPFKLSTRPENTADNIGNGNTKQDLVLVALFLLSHHHVPAIAIRHILASL